MGAIHGSAVVLTADNKIIGASADAALEIKDGLSDATSRASNGWKENLQGFREWSGKIAALFIPDDAGLKALEDAHFTGTTVLVKFIAQSGRKYHGSARIESQTLAFPLRDTSRADFAFKGTGALSRGDGTGTGT